MIVFLSLIGVIALLFILTDRLRYRKVSGFLSIAEGALLSGLVMVLSLPAVGATAGLRIGLGLMFLPYSFILLGIIPDGNRYIQWLKHNSHWAYGPIMGLLLSVSAVAPAERLAVLFTFLLFLIPVIKLAEKYPFSFMEEKYFQKVDKILELFHLLGGIFIFITVMVIASDRVRFFEKVVDYFF